MQVKFGTFESFDHTDSKNIFDVSRQPSSGALEYI